MQIVILYLATAIPFLVIDAVMLTRVMRPLFERHIGDLLIDSPRLGPAALFYLAYVAGVLLFVSVPALRAESVAQAFVMGAAFGALAYGTYEFTSYAVMRDWHWHMVLADTAWGAVLTGGSAALGLWIVRMIHPAG